MKPFLVHCFSVFVAIHVTQVGQCQTTNAIPNNIFLTDNERLFWYKPSGEKVVKLDAIKDAQKSVESLPASDDPEGNWGTPTNGFQLGLRLGKIIYTNGEPIIARTLMRNVTGQTQTFFPPVRIVVRKHGNEIEMKEDKTNPLHVREISTPPIIRVFPQTQRLSSQDLCQIYDLTQSGEYVIQAICTRPNVSSQIQVITIR